MAMRQQSRKEKSGIDCPARTIRQEDLQAVVVTAITDAWSRKDAVLPALKENWMTLLVGMRMSSLQRLMASLLFWMDRQKQLLSTRKH